MLRRHFSLSVISGTRLPEWLSLDHDHQMMQNQCAECSHAHSSVCISMIKQPSWASDPKVMHTVTNTLWGSGFKILWCTQYSHMHWTAWTSTLLQQCYFSVMGSNHIQGFNLWTHYNSVYSHIFTDSWSESEIEIEIEMALLKHFAPLKVYLGSVCHHNKGVRVYLREATEATTN